MAQDARPTPLRRWSSVGLTGAVTLAAVLDGAVGSGGVVDSLLMLAAAVVAGCLLGAWTHHAIAATGVLTVATALTWANQRHFGDEFAVVDDFAFFLILVGAPALLGAALVARIRQVRELAALSEQLVEQRRDEIAVARLDEQHRIELAVHHGLAERMGAIALRAEGARDQENVSVRDVLAQIEETARAGLDDLREALGVLREEPASPVAEDGGAVDDGAARAVADEAGRTDPLRRTRQAEPAPDRTDVLLVVGLGVAISVESVVSSASRGPAWANVLLALAVASPLLVRRQSPVVALAGMFAVGTASSTVLTPLPAMVAPIALLLVAAYAVGSWAHGWWRAVGVAVMWLGLVVLAIASPPEASAPEGLVPTMIWSALAVGAGMTAASWSSRAEQMRQVVLQLERLRDTDVRVAVARQRQLIARDLHDSVAHTLSVVCLNAGAAQHNCTAMAPDALATIADAARSGMTELRRGLHTLEPGDGLKTPALRLLAHRLGLTLHLVTPDPAELDNVDTALAHRVLREALVNAGRHAPGARVHAVVSPAANGVRVEVVDSGPGTAHGPTHDAADGDAAWSGLGAGAGLAGLAGLVRERGGELEFGPVATGGFRIAATIPSPARAPRAGSRARGLSGAALAP
ncbi:histidine kinase [Ornithinimicrobium cryptoxanthini]|uniref:histidine kinase n=1 Tax=Ornithinimicrobium cryptoxanthini TaxID=2934161 RepID=UPI00211902D8|nr:histidine kinase [Ornithinimicrobium cryptoxanthini]